MYEELLEFLDAIGQDPKLWMIFYHIKEFVDSFTTQDENLVLETPIKSETKFFFFFFKKSSYENSQ